MSTGEKNKALVCRFLEAQSTGDLEALEELLAPDFVDHGLLPGQDPGREGFMQGVAEAHAALSSIRTTIEYQGTDGDDMVITRHTTRTIHDRGPYLGLMAPTGQERETRGMLIHRVSGGKIVEESGALPAVLRSWRLSRRRYASAIASSMSYRWPETSSWPHSPKGCPPWRTGRSTLTASLPGRWEATWLDEQPAC
jgi:ketosteroid isomerase-like protein